MTHHYGLYRDPAQRLWMRTYNTYTVVFLDHQPLKVFRYERDALEYRTWVWSRQHANRVLDMWCKHAEFYFPIFDHRPSPLKYTEN